MENIGTIANSGTKKYLEGLDKNQTQDSNLLVNLVLDSTPLLLFLIQLLFLVERLAMIRQMEQNGFQKAREIIPLKLLS